MNDESQVILIEIILKMQIERDERESIRRKYEENVVVL